MAPTQPGGWKPATHPSPLQNCWQQQPSGAAANQGCWLWEATGTSCAGAGPDATDSCERTGGLPTITDLCERTRHLPRITDSCERTGGLSTASSAPLWSLYQMVKSTGTGFSFPPKLDKLKINELVRGKVKSSMLLSKKVTPFADFMSENITDTIRHGTEAVLEAWSCQKTGRRDTSMQLSGSAEVGAATPTVPLNYSSVCASRKAEADTS